jgi:hypothetical protein
VSPWSRATATEHICVEAVVFEESSAYPDRPFMISQSRISRTEPRRAALLQPLLSETAQVLPFPLCPSLPRLGRIAFDCNVWVLSGNLSVAHPMAALPRAQNRLFGDHITAPLEKARKSLCQWKLVNPAKDCVTHAALQLWIRFSIQLSGGRGLGPRWY